MAKLFRREQHSLFGEILDWMLTPLLLLWPVSLALTWLVAQNIAGRPFDRGLEYNVQALAQLHEALRIRRPQHSDRVEAVLGLELANVLAQLLDILGLGADKHIVGAVLLVRGDKVRVVDRRQRHDRIGNERGHQCDR